jgi:hypothetical protein
MGVTLGFTRVTPEDLEKAIDDPEQAEEILERVASEDRAGEPDGYLDKAWGGLQFLLDAAKVPVDLRMDGEFIDDEAYLSAWDAYVVAETARHLRAISFEDLARHFDPVRMTEQDIYPAIWERDDALGYLKAHYAGLVEFFEAAAAAGAAAISHFG